MKIGIIRTIEEIWENRRLLFDLSKKDYQKRFSGTYFGVGWAFIQPTLSILVYIFAFQFGFRSVDIVGVPYAMWFTCGIVPWLFLSDGISTASNSFLEYDYLIKKVKFNITILPLVKILSSLYIHLFFVIITVIMSLIYRIPPSFMLIQIVYYAFCAICLLFGFSLVTSSIMVFFRDLNQIISVVLLVGMWGTPIAWSLDNFSESLHKYFKANPFYYIIEGYRDSILGRKWLWEKPVLTIYFWAVVLALLILGGFVFYRLRDYFAESV